MTKYQVVLHRFLKGFVATAVPVITTQLAGITDPTPENLKRVGLSLIIPLISGLLLALDKSINYVENYVEVKPESQAQIQA